MEGINIQKNAFHDGFSVVACLVAWEKSAMGDAKDKMNDVTRAMHAENEWATYTLTMRGFRGNLLEAQCLKEKMVRPITKPHSLER